MTTTDDFIPFALPDIGEEEIAEVVKTLRSGWLTAGPVTKQFEAEFRDYVQAGTSLAVNSCTAGLHLALTALGIGPGDEVITTPLTFCATVNVILHSGARPVLVDIGSDLNLNPAAVEKAITKRTRAILPVHFAGLPCNMDAIWNIAKNHGLLVVEDAAHAVGALYKNRPIGSGQSDAVAFSFYATKNLTSGEGGMVTSPHASLAHQMRTLCLHGISHDAWGRYTKEGSWFYEVVECGFKYNMSDIMAAIGIHQLRKLERMTARRVEIARQYSQIFSDIAELEIPPDRDDCRHCWHLYTLRLRLDQLSIDRSQFFAEMRALGIGCSVHFIPIPLHPHYRHLADSGDPCRGALAEYPRLISLPLYSKMTDGDVARVIDAVKAIITKSRRSRHVVFPTSLAKG